MSKEKISLQTAKKLPIQTLLRMIKKAKETLKKDEVWKKLCREYQQDINVIDHIPTTFGIIDVSAKTDHGIVILNYKLLCDGFTNNYSYLIHEYCHWMQQCLGDKPTQSADDGDYLHNPSEQEGFQNQIEYIANHEGNDEAEKYVANLLEHHDKEGKEKDQLEDILMDKV